MELFKLDAKINRLRLELHLELESQNHTLQNLLDWYLTIVQQEQLSPYTIRQRRYALQHLITFFGPDFRIAKLSREHLNEYKRHLLRTSQNGAYWELQKLQTIFRKALYEDFIQHHPFFGFQYPRRDRSRHYTLLTPNEMFQVRSLFHAEHTRLAWDIARFTGIRGNDLFRLDAKNFNFSQKIIHYFAHKIGRFEAVIMHPNLVPYIEHLQSQAGRIFTLKSSENLGKRFRYRIRQLKGTCNQIGLHTPRYSLGHYLRAGAKWSKENISIFLCHHPTDDTQLYLFEHLELIRDAVNALPFI